MLGKQALKFPFFEKHIYIEGDKYYEISPKLRMFKY